MTGNNNVYKTIWNNGKNDIMTNRYAAFLITCKCGRVLFRTSVYFPINKRILIFSYSLHVPCIIFCHVCFYIVRFISPFLFNWSQSKASVINQMNQLFFEAQKYFFALFKMVKFTLFWRWSTLWNSTLKITTLFRHCLTLLISTLKKTTLIWRCSRFIANLNVDIHNIVSTLIWEFPMSRGLITLTTTLRECWKVSWVLTNVAKDYITLQSLSNWTHIYLA